MAAGVLPAPGKKVRGVEIGPCVNPCEHTDCAATRRSAESICRLCEKPIGYETRFYNDGPGSLVHAVCLEDSIDAERPIR